MENEKGFIKTCSNPKYMLKTGKEVINVDSNYYRPTEVDLLIGDPTKAKSELGWEPKLDINDLVNEMMTNDLKLIEKEKLIIEAGFNKKNYYENE